MQKTLQERIEIMRNKIKNTKFFENDGSDKGIQHWIFDYPPEKELFMREQVKYLVKDINSSQDRFKVQVFDIYDIIMEHFEQEGILEPAKEMEQNEGIEVLCENLLNVLDIGGNDDYILKYIREHTENNTVVFLTGIGKCYPIVRSHSVLNVLHQHCGNLPVVLFYPGKFSIKEMVLLENIEDGNFYRALTFD